MLLALVNGLLTKAAPGLHGQCSTCHDAVIAKCGDIRIWHWSHTSDTNCDTWDQGETPWRTAWKNCAPTDRQEVTIGGHRIDVIAGDKTPVGIQHSALAVSEVAEREANYGDMRWIFDAQDKEFDWESFEDTPTTEPFRWKIHRKHTWHAIGACARRVMLDFGDTGVLSCEKINTTGTWGWGFLYPPNTIARWIAGPDYRAGWYVR